MLKQCEWCLEADSEYVQTTDRDGNYGVQVECLDCGITGPMGDNELDASAYWNRMQGFLDVGQFEWMEER